METPIFRAEKCPLTGVIKPNLKHLEIKIPEGAFSRRGFQWFYPFNNDVLLIVEGDLFEDQLFWDANKSAIYYLIENKIWPSGRMVDKPLLEALISSSDVPKSPFEKMKEVLSFISINQKHFGEWYSLDSKDYGSIVRKLGLFSPGEFEGLIRESANYGLLEIKVDNKEGMVVILSMKGWELAEERNQSKQSDTVFVAMAFSDEMKEIFNSWIRPAIEECGFKAKIVSEDYLKGDQTINDAILVGIKKAKFTLADFTDHRNGVYFEAGYALGLGQNVIYSCKDDGIKDAHFDTRNYQHLVWRDGADLKKKLMDKIEVFIKA